MNRMDRIIDFRAPTFTVMSHDLFCVLSNHIGIQQLKLTAHNLIFTRDPELPNGITIFVETQQPLEKFEIISFLSSIGRFGSDRWLNYRFDQFGGIFTLNIGGDSVTLGELVKHS